MSGRLRRLLGRLRAATDRAREWLLVANGLDPDAAEALQRARAEGAREMAAAIARQILADVPARHPDIGVCGGVARCATCARESQARIAAQVAQLAGAQR